jgi:transketolase
MASRILEVFRAVRSWIHPFERGETMAVGIDSKIAALEDVATRLRINSIRATTAAGSGHPTSCASAADLVAAIFFDAMRFDPAQPRDPGSDRFVLSKGHAAPVLYAAWAEVGTVKADDLLTLRQLGSDLEGHPTPRLPFVDVATGSLGQGLSAGVGLALGARLAGTDARVYVLLGDGEIAEGSVWEAAAMASHQKLGSLVAVLDVNALGQSGPTMLRHDVKTYQKRFAAFGWRALVIEGHDMRAIVGALAKARRGKDAPTAIVARTVKGQGIDEVAGREGWHGKALPKDLADRAITALEARLHHVPAPTVTRPKRRRTTPVATASPLPPALDAPAGSSAATRETYGEALVRLGAVNDKVVVLDGDVKNSTFAEKFLEAYPDRYIEAFIAEQNMVGVAGGLAAQGFVPFASSFACFLERATDQIRMLGISHSGVKLCGSHVGVSIGEDGPSQMALEDLAVLRTVPDMVLFYPSDAVSTEACVRLAAEHRGMAYIRTTRPKTPVLYPAGEPFSIGGLKVVRAGDADRCTIVGAGITLHEALAAHEELAKAGIATRVIDLYCVKPIDAAGLRAAARATGNRILTVEDHYPEGGIGDAVLEAVGDAGVAVHRLAVGEVPRSGPARRLLETYGIDRGAIARKVREIVG